MRIEPIDHPADRRLAVGSPLRVDRARDDQPVDRPRHRDVVEAEALLALLLLGRLLHLLPREHALAPAARRVHRAEAEAAVRERDDLVRASRAPRVAARVSDDHDLELEPLGGMDRQQPHRTRSLLLRDRLELLRADRLLLSDEAREAGDVCAADGLVLACEPGELAEIGEAARAVPASEHGEVVVVLREHLLAERLEAAPRRRANEPLVALEERAQQPLVSFGEPLRQPSLERREEGTASRIPPDEYERVVRDADERGGEHGRQGHVVVAVVQQPEVREEIHDLLLPEVPAPRRAVRGQALAPKRLLVRLRIGPRREQHDDLPRGGRTGVDELPHPPGDRPRLPETPVLLRVGVARLVGDEQLHGVPEDRVCELGRGRERLVLVAEGISEEVVHGRQHLRAGAVVLGQREEVRRLRASLAEDLDVGVPEPVDRLELVADGEDLGQLRMGDEVDELALEPVRVLELVDHDEAEAELDLLAEPRIVPQEVARVQLEVLEVDRRLAPLRGVVLLGESHEQLLEQIPVERRELLERRALDRLARRLVRSGSRSAALERGEVDDPLRRRLLGRHPQGLRGVAALRRGRGVVRDERRCLLAKSRDRIGEARPLSELEVELAAGRPERLVDAGQHPPEAVGPIRGEEPEALGIRVRAEGPQGTVERLASQHRRARILELAEAGIQADREGMRLQEAVAEPVDRRDPRTVELAREIVPAPSDERRANPRPELPRGLARVRDDEDRVDVDPPLAYGTDVALDEHRRLPRAGARGHEDGALGLDGGELLVVQAPGDLDHRHALATLHMGQRSHHAGHPSPFGSCRTSPLRIRRALSAATSRAASTSSQNASSSR